MEKRFNMLWMWGKVPPQDTTENLQLGWLGSTPLQKIEHIKMSKKKNPSLKWWDAR